VTLVYWCINLSSISLLTGAEVFDRVGVGGCWCSRGIGGGGIPGDVRCLCALEACAGTGCGVGGMGLGAAGVEAEASSSATSADSKSHTTPCFMQLPHLGWTSSHLILRTLHLRQPARDFLCDLRGGMAASIVAGPAVVT